MSLHASPSSKEETPEIKQLAPFRPEPGRGKFLIAARKLIDPNFSETVVLLIDYGSHGAMGVVINRPTPIKLSEVLPDIKGLKDRSDFLYIGGPVQRDRLMLMVKSPHRPKEGLAILEDIYIGAKPEVLQEMIDRSDPKERFRAFAGYAGWSPDQLDREVARGDWHILRADPVTIFDKDRSKIWPDLIRYFTSKWVNNDSPQENTRAL
jgi:putative transcriptional regulator